MLTRIDIIKGIMAPATASFQGHADLEQRFFNRLNRLTNQHLAELLYKYTGNLVTPVMSNLFI